MNTSLQEYRETLEQICRETVAPHSHNVDRDAAFPKESIAALKNARFLGAKSAKDDGGLGLTLGDCASIVRRVAQDCASTAMVLCMHYCGVAVIEAHGPESVRRAVAAGEHLSTLAFSETASRSHFWSPASTAVVNGEDVVLNASKSWITSASEATTYVWSSKPTQGDGFSTIWLVPAKAEGIAVEGRFEGLGLRGNDSAPVSAKAVRIRRSDMLGNDGGGFDIMMGIALPNFVILNSACSLGLMGAAVQRTANHVKSTRHSDTGNTLADLPTIRSYIAQMRVKTDMISALLEDTIAAIETGREDALLRTLACKAAAGETAAEVLDLAMRVCGGAAYRKEVTVERYFRDSRAAGIMAPTTDVLDDFIGKACCGLPLF